MYMAIKSHLIQAGLFGFVDRLRSRSCGLVVFILSLQSCVSLNDEHLAEVSLMVEDMTGFETHYRGSSSLDAVIAELLLEPMTLTAALQIALWKNADLQASYKELDIADALLVEASLLPNPIFSADIAYHDDNHPDFDFDISLVENFLGILLRPAKKKIAAAQFEATKLQVTAEVLDVLGSTRASYYRQVAAQEKHGLRSQVLAAMAASYEFAQILFEAGNVTVLDLYDEQLLFEEARINLADAELALAQSREQLNQVLGLWGNHTNWQTPERLPELPEADPLTDFEANIVAASIDLKIAEQEVNSLAFRYGLARSTAWVFDWNLGLVTRRDDEIRERGFAFDLPLPFFNQGQTRNAVAQARLQQRQQQLIATAVRLRSQARLAQQTLQVQRQQVLHYQDVILPLQTQIVSENQAMSNAMQIGVFRLLQAKRMQIEAGESYVDNLLGFWLAKTSVEQLKLGRMTHQGDLSQSRLLVNVTPQGNYQ